MIFTEKEQQAIHKILEVFLNAKQKYHILKYINTTEKSHPLRNLLCEALFRNIVLELYSVLYDTTPNTIANTINNKLINKSKENNGVFKLSHDLTIHNMDDGSIRVEPFHQELKLSIDESNDTQIINLNISEVRQKFKKYRNKILAHKDFPQFDYHIFQDDIEMLIAESEKIITVLLKIIKPGTAYCLDVSILVNDNAITSLFNKLAGNKNLNSAMHQQAK